MVLGPAIAPSSSPFTCLRARRFSPGRAPAGPVRFSAAGAPFRCESRLFCRKGTSGFPECGITASSAPRISTGAPLFRSAVARNRGNRYVLGEFLDARVESGGGSSFARAIPKPSEGGECRNGDKFRILNIFVGRGIGILVAATICGMFAIGCQRVLAQESVSHVSVSVLGKSGMVLKDAWPQILQVLRVFKEQGLILAALLGLSAFFSLAETAITTLWPWKVRELAEKEPENGVFRMLRSDVTRFLTTILIGTTVVNIGATALVTEAATTIFGEAGVSAATGVMTVAILLLTEITPKSVAVHNATEVARFVVRPVAWLSLILYPVGRVVTFLSMGMLKLLGLKGRSEPYVTEDELKLMLRGAELSGAIEEEEQDMIENVLEIKDTHVREVMTPLVDVVAIDASAKLIDFQKLWVTHQYSRVPVFEERVDNIVGIAYAMDMLEYVEKVEQLQESTVGDIAHKPTYFVPDSISVWNLLREFRIRKVHMAVVLNEYGGTVGIVTLEDVVEEIVGEIFDENDSKEEIQKKTGDIVMLDDGSFRVDANTSIDQLSEELNVKISEGHQYETVSGFICEAYGCIPNEGDKVQVVLEKVVREENDEYTSNESDHPDESEKHQTFELEILEANARKVGTVMFRPIENQCVGSQTKGLNRILSTKVVKRKKCHNGESESDKDDEILPQERSKFGSDQEVPLQDRSEGDSNCYVTDGQAKDLANNKKQ
uniref:DUF21 domain-containing protein At1g55930, chloroplastic n=2 Tax=Anthurium amnicola TaxID=1678845 RepID=A0A1D1YQI3_9ARAE